eukprot:1593934-Prymnesium_polylepis.1
MDMDMGHGTWDMDMDMDMWVIWWSHWGHIGVTGACEHRPAMGPSQRVAPTPEPRVQTAPNGSKWLHKPFGA